MKSYKKETSFLFFVVVEGPEGQSASFEERPDLKVLSFIGRSDRGEESQNLGLNTEKALTLPVSVLVLGM